MSNNAFYRSIPVSTHVLNFHTNERPELPEWFKQTAAYKYHDVKICIGAGDNPENIANMMGYDVYISLPDVGLYREHIDESIRLAEQNNKLLIFIDLGGNPQEAHLVELFKYRVSLLDCDDDRPMHWLGVDNATSMLRPGGILIHDYSKGVNMEPPESGANIKMSSMFTKHYGKHPLKGKQNRLPFNSKQKRGEDYEYFIASSPSSSEIIIDLSVEPRYGWNVLPEQWINGYRPNKPGPYNAIVIGNNTKIESISDIMYYYDIIIYIGISQQMDKIWKNGIVPLMESENRREPRQIVCFANINSPQQYIKLAILLENKINILDADNELRLKSLGNDNIYHMLTVGGKCMANLNMPARFDCGTSQHPMIEVVQATWGPDHAESFSPEKTFNVCIKKEETGREGGGAGGVPAMGGAPLYRSLTTPSEFQERPNNGSATTVPAATNLTVTGNNVPALGSPQYYASLAASASAPAPAPSTLNWRKSYIPWSKGGKRHTKRKRSSKKKRYSKTRKYNK